MKKPKKPSFSVAMSKDTGCIVMVRSNGQKMTVIGSMTREDSLSFADGLIDWKSKLEQGLIDTIDGQKPADPEQPRPAYPH